MKKYTIFILMLSFSIQSIISAPPDKDGVNTPPSQPSSSSESEPADEAFNKGLFIWGGWNMASFKGAGSTGEETQGVAGGFDFLFHPPEFENGLLFGGGLHYLPVATWSGGYNNALNVMAQVRIRSSFFYAAAMLGLSQRNYDGFGLTVSTTGLALGFELGLDLNMGPIGLNLGAMYTYLPETSANTGAGVVTFFAVGNLTPKAAIYFRF